MLAYAERGPYLGRRPRNILEARGHHADDAILIAVEHDASADDRRVGAESSAPHAVADDRNEVAARLIFSTSQSRGQAPA